MEINATVFKILGNYTFPRTTKRIISIVIDTRTLENAIGHKVEIGKPFALSEKEYASILESEIHC